MGTIANTYAKQLNKQTKFYYAQWMPSSVIVIGTVGELEDGRLFRPKTTLKDMGISFNPDEDIVEDNDPSPIDLVSSKGVEIITKLSGEVSTALPNVPKAKAGLGINFSSSGSFILKAKETYEPRIRNVLRLEKEILKAYEKGTWKKNFALIYSIVKTPYADIIVSQTSGSGLELELQGDANISSVELGNINTQFSIKKQSGTVLNMLNSKNVTPIFQLIGVKKKWFTSPNVGPLNMVRSQTGSVGIKEDDPSLLYVDLLKDESDF